MSKEQRSALRALAEAEKSTVYKTSDDAPPDLKYLTTALNAILPLLNLVEKYEKALENIADLDLSFYRDGFSALSMGQIAREALEGGSGK